MSHLTESQRYTIQALSTKGFTQTQIAEIINKHKSVVCKALKRKCDQRNKIYKFELATKKYIKRHKEKPKNSCFTAEIKTNIIAYIKKDYSPEQIVGYFKLNKMPCVSIEQIYQNIWRDKSKGGLLFEHLRSRGNKYISRSLTNDKRRQIIDRVEIEMRPNVVEQKIGSVSLSV